MKKIRQNRTQTYNRIINDKFKSLFTSNNLHIICHILPYLTYKELISLSNTAKSFYKIIRSHKCIKSYIIKSKLQPEYRLLFYITNLNISQTKLTIEKELSEYNIHDNYYTKILNLSKDAYVKDKRFKKICDEIDRDLHRTFYTEKFSKGNGKNMLKNILTSLGFVRPEIGYCQGMNFIAGALVSLIDNEEKCFWIFLTFIDNIQLNLLYLKNMPDFLIRVFQLKNFIELYFPKLYNHLKRNKINIDLFFSKWLLTIFSNYFPFDVLYKVWDVFIIDKWKALFKFCMIILYYMKEDMMNMDLPMFCNYFQSKELLTSLSFEQMIKHYNDYKITNKKLKELRQEFFMSQVESKLNNPNSEWEDDQHEYVINYRKDLEKHLNSIKEPMETLTKKIEKNKKDYAYKQDKYEKQFDFVCKLKIEIEAKYEVKAGYENIFKNLFANINESNKENNNNKSTNLNIVEDKKNSEGIIGSIMSFFNNDNSENAKIQKKIKDINKIIDDKNKVLDYNQKILDKYKNELEICRNEQMLWRKNIKIWKKIPIKLKRIY